MGPRIKRFFFAACLLVAVPAVRAEVSPLTLTLLADYGSPVQPLGLAQSTTDAIGFEFMAEWNASNYASFGLSFEQQTFYYGPGFSIPTVNLESRLFPFENGKNKFSPYIYGGAGLNLSSTGGPFQLKAGLGSRVALAGPLFFDLAVGSHWFVDPGSLQYVDGRAGLSVFIDFKPGQVPTPTPAPAAPTSTPAPIASPVAQASPTHMATPDITPEVISLEDATPTPPPVIDLSVPVTSVAEGKFYYKIGNDAFGVGNYPLAMKAYKKSLTLKEKHKAAYYYAETYAQLGVIYQFHAKKIKDHNKKALGYYKQALAIDKKTKSAKKFYPKLKAQMAKEAAAAKKKGKTKKKPKLAAVESTSTTSSEATPTSP
jgi:tetratricopeptide (TPR) repeat protein